MLSVETFDSLQDADRSMNGRSRYLGGGTIVMRAVNYGDTGFERLVRTTDPVIGQIKSDREQVEVGAGVTMSAIMSSPDLAFLAPAARAVGGPAIRNMASIGGNLFAQSPYGDLATALLALGARIRMANGTELDAEKFLASRDTAQELVESVVVPRPDGEDFRFMKATRVRPKGVAIVSIAVLMQLRLGRVETARVAFGAMGSAPGRARSVEAALQGADLDQRGVAGALDLVRGDIAPRDDALASAWYRQEIAPVYLRRLLLQKSAGS